MNYPRILFVVLILFLLTAGIFFASNKDNSKCRALAGQGEKFFCYRDLALEQKDISLCNYVPVPKDGIGYDKESCQIYYAGETQDLSVCAKVKTDSGKAFCYGSVVFAKKDPALCQTLSDQYYRDNCYKLYSAYGNSAYVNSKLEIYANSKLLCDKIVDPNIRLSCTKEAAPSVLERAPSK